MTTTSGKVRVHALAKSVGLTTAELRGRVAELGFDWDVSNAMKTLTAEQVAEFEAAHGGKKKPAAKKAAAKKAPAKKAAAKKPAAKKAPAKKSAKDDAAAEEAPPKKAPAKKTTKKAAKDADEAAPKSTGRKKSAKGADAAAEGSADAPKEKKSKKDERGDDGRGRRGRRDDHRRDEPDPEGFDPIPAARAYLTSVLDALGVRARVTGSYDGRRLQLELAGPGVNQLIGARNAGARPELVDGLQTLTGRAAFGDRAGTKNVYIDVDGFRAGRVDALAAAGKRIARFVAETGRSVHLPAMNNFDRYAFHNAAGGTRGVFAESEGNGVFRMLGIKPRRPRRDDERKPKAPVEQVEAVPEAPEVAADAAPDTAEPATEEKSRRRRRRSPKTEAAD